MNISSFDKINLLHIHWDATLLSKTLYLVENMDSQLETSYAPIKTI